jgi:heat shock transcription factor, other eukaryote
MHKPTAAEPEESSGLVGIAAGNTAAASKVSKKKSQKDRPIPAFLTKLYLIVNDASTDSLISWGDDKKSFIVKNSEKFSTQILPKYFKHSNFTSFVRQLNMYGFHKQPSVENRENYYEFRNENFIKSRQDLLTSIAKIQKDKHTTSDQKVDLQELLVEIGQIKVQQQAISSELVQIQQSNQAMWEQSLVLSRCYHDQKDTIEKIVGFLASVFSKSSGDGVEEGGRRLLNAKILSAEENGKRMGLMGRVCKEGNIVIVV